jgi:hypothetical protein
MRISTYALILLAAAACACGGGEPETPAPGTPSWSRCTRVARDQDHPTAIAVDGAFAYFMTGGTTKGDNAIRRVALDGGQIETVSQGGFVPAGAIAVDDASVYWTNEYGGTLMRAPKTGGSPERLAGPLQGFVRFVALDADAVYVAAFDRQQPTGAIYRIAKGGGEPAPIVTGQPTIGGLAVDETSVYWTTPAGVMKVAKAGGQPAAVVAAGAAGPPIRVLADAQNLYFFWPKETGKYTLARVAKTGGEPVVLADPVYATMDLAATDTAIFYFAQEGIGYALRSVEKAGGAPRTLDTGLIPSGQLAAADSLVYFTDLTTLYRLGA